MPQHALGCHFMVKVICDGGGQCRTLLGSSTSLPKEAQAEWHVSTKVQRTGFAFKIIYATEHENQVLLERKANKKHDVFNFAVAVTLCQAWLGDALTCQYQMRGGIPLSYFVFAFDIAFMVFLERVRNIRALDFWRDCEPLSVLQRIDLEQAVGVLHERHSDAEILEGL